MGFYLRKSVRVGPFRFNLSKSGIGVSAGIKGFRVGSGPRGNYVHMGRGGLYYRASLPAGSSPRPTALSSPPPTIGNAGLTEIESGSVLEMVDGSATALLAELNDKRRKSRFWIAALVFTFAAALMVSETAAPPVLLGGLLVTLGVSQLDAVRRTTVLFYDLEGLAEERYRAIHDVFAEIAACGRIGHIAAQGAVKDRKYHAGASSVLRRKVIRLSTASPPRVKTNIAVPAIPVGRQTLHFFPDRLLVFDRDGIGAVGYDTLDLEVRENRFIEDEGVPNDAKVVGQTWRYVNKKGGPDRRFKHNPELPIALYEEIRFQSPSGLNEVIQVSRLGLGERFGKVLKQVASIVASPADPKQVIPSIASEGRVL